MHKSRAIFIFPTRSSFIEIDRRILSQKYELKEIYLAQDKSKALYLYSIFRMVAWIKLSFRTKRVFIWFADYHALPAVWTAKLFGKKSIIFIGGYDAVHYPELRMGVHQSFLRSLCNQQALKTCDLIIANHSALISGINRYYDNGGHRDGIKHFITNLSTPTRIVFNGIDIADYSPEQSKRMPDTILTVANTPRYEDFINKGLDLLVEVAKSHPQWSFTFVGIDTKWHQRLAREYGLNKLSNLKIISRLPHKMMRKLYESHKVYAQPSISEGMPNALIEAMSFCCVPVGSDVAGIPEVIGEHGFVIGNRSVDELEAALQKALASENRLLIRAYVIEKFSFATRSKNLILVLDEFEAINPR